MSKRKICVVTGSRAEYGLLYRLIKEIESDKNLKLQLIVTGMHLSREFGSTYREIEKDFKIDKKINISLNSDTSVGISKSMSIAHSSFSKVIEELKPDIIVVLGDRYEIFSVASASVIANIPIAHIHGGEITEGSWDDNFRHCITKMAHLHFVATEEYKKRVLQLGEDPSKIFNFGALGVENIHKMKLLKKVEVENSINFKFNVKNLLVTFHPVTLGNNSSTHQFKEILNALDELENTNIIFTYANSDLHGKKINKMINKYIFKNPKNTTVFKSLGQQRYLSTLKYLDAVLGNSSSGIIEAPSFKIATINIGDRQKGRIKANSVIECLPKKKDIKKSIQKVYSKKFQQVLKKTKNPYDKGSPSKNIFRILKYIELKNILKKKFNDINLKL